MNLDSFLKNFIGFEGRLNRQPFWLSLLLLAAIGVLLSLVVLPLIGLSVMPNFAELAQTNAQDMTPEQVSEFISKTINDATRISGWVSLGLFVVLLYPSLAIGIKRRHDRNSSGIDLVIYYVLSLAGTLISAFGLAYSTMTLPAGPDLPAMTIPVPSMLSLVFTVVLGIYGVYLFIVMGCLRGTVGENNYGPDPLG
jgi:uncharacterized membrane protein YhaH (DUF805 family)